MTPLERALKCKNEVNYCDECANFILVGRVAYCKDSGKMIHPLMVMRGQGTGGAHNCKRAVKKGEQDENT